MIETKRQGGRWSSRLWQALFVMALVATVLFETAPGASANTIGLLTGRRADAMERVDASRILLMNAEGESADIVLGADKKVTIRHDDAVRYATSRADEHVSELLQREGVDVGELELIRVSVSETEAQLDIGSTSPTMRSRRSRRSMAPSIPRITRSRRAKRASCARASPARGT